MEWTGNGHLEEGFSRLRRSTSACLNQSMVCTTCANLSGEKGVAVWLIMGDEALDEFRAVEDEMRYPGLRGAEPPVGVDGSGMSASTLAPGTVRQWPGVRAVASISIRGHRRDGPPTPPIGEARPPPPGKNGPPGE